MEPEREPDYVLNFGGLVGGNGFAVYPHYMYRDDDEPILINNEEEEKEARKKGYDHITAGTLANRHLVNWFWDLEDMSPKQLVVFAKEEYGIELPIEAGQLKLFEALCELTKHSPKNRNRLILMAHTVAMNYDETLEQIQRTIENPDPTANIETEKYEITI